MFSQAVSDLELLILDNCFSNLARHGRRHYNQVRLMHYSRIEEDLAAAASVLRRGFLHVWKMWSKRKVI